LFMDSEKDISKEERLPAEASNEDEIVAQSSARGGEQRIQFTQTVKPDRGRPAVRKETASASTAAAKRPQSVTSIPAVISEKEKKRRKREKEEGDKHVDITEHLMAPQEVAEKFSTRINMNKPGESLGLTRQEVDSLLQEYGHNVLTPPKKRHPFLKYLDYLFSLFNLLLIFAGILEYILLGINFKDNFQNVSATWRSAKGLHANAAVLTV
jgi:sodium/potassium-transporting ATPase subunit alpha